jgi:hypothetical protein
MVRLSAIGSAVTFLYGGSLSSCTHLRVDHVSTVYIFKHITKVGKKGIWLKGRQVQY